MADTTTSPTANDPNQQPQNPASTKASRGKQPQFDAAILESIVINGDLSKLSNQQKMAYYSHFCHRVGLDPTSQPFKLLTLKGKQILYCDRSGAQQLNKVHEVSHAITSREIVAGIYVVTARASLPAGRFTESIGAAPVENIRGEDLANAMMKAETKAKRRSTLDLLGLGILEETEATGIEGGQTMSITEATAQPETPAGQQQAPPAQGQSQQNSAQQRQNQPAQGNASPPANSGQQQPPQAQGQPQGQHPSSNPFHLKYATPQEVAKVLATVNPATPGDGPLKDTTNLYYVNADTVEASARLKAEFAAMKQAILNHPVRANQQQQQPQQSHA